MAIILPESNDDNKKLGPADDQANKGSSALGKANVPGGLSTAGQFRHEPVSADQPPAANQPSAVAEAPKNPWKKWIKPLAIAAGATLLYLGWSARPGDKWNLVDARVTYNKMTNKPDSLKITAVDIKNSKDTIFAAWPIKGVEKPMANSRLWKKADERAVLRIREAADDNGFDPDLSDPSIGKNKHEQIAIWIQENEDNKYDYNDLKHRFVINKEELKANGKLDAYKNISDAFDIPGRARPGNMYLGEGTIEKPPLLQRLKNIF